ncbi:hypothetical protein [Actinocrispum sp. NPDC049592]|uniref:hypothetical protein n=1 Tax=Actinocrispum sp. NPDC049592 TaxID=3154835 RepID=UPI003430A99E
MDRRTLLRASALSIVAGVALPGTALAGTRLPDVPGMLGDRKANEFWYVFDDRSFYNPTDDLLTKYGALQDHLGALDFNTALRDK